MTLQEYLIENHYSGWLAEDISIAYENDDQSLAAVCEYMLELDRDMVGEVLKDIFKWEEKTL